MTIPQIEERIAIQDKRIEDLESQVANLLENLAELRDQLGIGRMPQTMPVNVPAMPSPLRR